MNKIIKENGKEYVIILCPKCQNELHFLREPRGRRVHCMCKNCLKELEIEVK